MTHDFSPTSTAHGGGLQKINPRSIIQALSPLQDSLPRPAHLRHNPRHTAAFTLGQETREVSVSERPWSSTAPPGEFRTYVSAEENVKEFSVRAVILGALFG